MRPCRLPQGGGRLAELPRYAMPDLVLANLINLHIPPRPQEPTPRDRPTKRTLLAPGAMSAPQFGALLAGAPDQYLNQLVHGVCQAGSCNRQCAQSPPRPIASVGYPEAGENLIRRIAGRRLLISFHNQYLHQLVRGRLGKVQLAIRYDRGCMGIVPEAALSSPRDIPSYKTIPRESRSPPHIRFLPSHIRSLPPHNRFLPVFLSALFFVPLG